MKILVVQSAITGEHSITRLLSGHLLQSLKDMYPEASVVEHDLVQHSLPHFTLNPSPTDQQLFQKALDEYLEADVVVIGAPMYNFSIPSQLKTWVDAIAKAGITFRYTEHGPEGLYPNKKIIIVGSQGGIHDATSDFQERYLRQIFAFLGVKNVDVINAQGVALSETHRNEEIQRITNLFHTLKETRMFPTPSEMVAQTISQQIA